MPSNRKFGFFFSFLFCCLSGYFFYQDRVFYFFLMLSISLSLILVACLAPHKLFYLNKIWFRSGIALSKITAPIFLSSIYFFLITPLAILLKFFGRDELKLRTREKLSYWRDVPVSSTSNTDFKLQF